MAQTFPWQVQKLIVESAISSGISFEELPANLALYKHLLDKKRISQEDIDELMMSLERMTGRTDLAIQFAKAFIPEFVDDYFVLGYSAENLKQAVSLLSRYKWMLHPSLDLVVEEYEDTAAVIYRSTDGFPIADKYYYSEAMFSALLHRVRDLTEVSFNPKEIWFRHDKTPHYDRYQEYFACPVKHNQVYDAFILDKEILYLPFHTYSPESNAELQERAEAICLKHNSLISRINGVMLSYLADPDFGVEELAGQLHMSRRSLQRKLKELGQTFSGLKNNLRMDEAKKALQGSCHIEDLAERLGFVNAHSFRQFFKKQTGMTISEYREGEE